jgi:hypothetical protein
MSLVGVLHIRFAYLGRYLGTSVVEYVCTYIPTYDAPAGSFRLESL